MNFTHNNHLKYYINDSVYGTRATVYDKFRVEVGKIDQDHYRQSNWVLEQARTADLVYREFGKDLIVFFSGGTDSEIVLRSFIGIGVKPRAVFIKFKNEYNIFDLVLATQIARELDINLEVVEVDIMDFYHSGAAWELAEQIHCRQIAYLNVYNQIRALDAPSVMGGEMLLRRETNPLGSRWHYCFRENEDASAMRFSNLFGIPLVNEWFSYTPEMMGYYLEHPKIQWLLNERYNYKLASVSTKNEVLKQYMPDILVKTKTHGYEKLMGLNNESYAQLYRSHTKRLEASLDGIYVDDLKIQLGLI